METQVITEKQRLARLDFIGIEDGHKAALTEVWPLLEGKLDGILDKFYAHLSAYPALQGHLGGDGKIDYLKKAQQAHWQLLFGGKFGEDYFGRAVAIGNAHQRIGLEPRWYVAGYAIVLGDLAASLAAMAPSVSATSRRRQPPSGATAQACTCCPASSTARCISASPASTTRKTSNPDRAPP